MKILLFGASGKLGKSVTKELTRRNLNFSIVVRNPKKLDRTIFDGINYLSADVTLPSTITNICEGFDVVISVLGKSVSLNDKSKYSYSEIDYGGNLLILNDALRHGVSKFVYVSALGAEKHLDLDYFKAHHDFSERLIRSGINYSVIKPPALFSAFEDLIDLAKKGKLTTIGKGDKKTNPIHEDDLAKIIADAIFMNNKILEAGGKNIYTRHEINSIIQNVIDSTKSVKRLPQFVFRLTLPIMRIIAGSSYHKFAFLYKVITSDAIAPQVGDSDFESYIRSKI